MDPYNLALAIIGLAALGMAWLRTALEKLPISYPIVYLLFGMLLYSLPIELPWPDPLWKEDYAVHLTELTVIVTLMGTGIKINRKFGWRRWAVPLRLATLTMLLCIGAMAVLGWWWLGLAPAAAMLLGAVLAPTDPVLASDVQVDPPSRTKEDQVRFSLTAEAGLNDGMAFPFTWLAVAMAIGARAGGEGWFMHWLWKDLLYRIVVGVGVGFLLGRLLAWLLFRLPRKTRFPKARDGFVALAATLLVYGVSELVHGYGFMAVFFAGLTIRSVERQHEYHRELHDFTDQIEHILMVVLLILFGGSIVTGLLRDLSWQGALLGLAFLLIIRPFMSLLCLLGCNLSRTEKLAISFFGIRGIGSFFYLAFGLQQEDIPHAGELWSIVGFTVLVSIVMHGVAAQPIMRHLDRQKKQAAGSKAEGENRDSG